MFIKAVPIEKRQPLVDLLNKDIELNKKALEHVENLRKLYQHRINVINEILKNRRPIEDIKHIKAQLEAI